MWWHSTLHYALQSSLFIPLMITWWRSCLRRNILELHVLVLQLSGVLYVFHELSFSSMFYLSNVWCFLSTQGLVVLYSSSLLIVFVGVFLPERMSIVNCILYYIKLWFVIDTLFGLVVIFIVLYHLSVIIGQFIAQ